MLRDCGGVEEEIEAVKRFLEERGYRVGVGARLKGESGDEYYFDVAAEKAGRRLCLDFLGPEAGPLLYVMAKALDVKDVELLVLIKGRVPQRLTRMLEACERPKAVFYRGVEDLLESLEEHVA